MTPRRLNRLLRDALGYAARGWPVHPLDGKRPIVKDWPNRASTDQAQLREWWREYPDANPGVIGGPRSGLTFIDVDNKGGKDGSAALEQLQREVGPLPATRRVRTPHGQHLYFADGTSRNNVGQLGDGLDVRGVGGYVVAPSAVVEGEAYEVVDDLDPAPLPDALRVRLGLRVVEPVTTIAEGNRDDELFRLAASCRGRGVSREAATELLCATNAKLCRPPLPERQVCKIVRSVYERYAGGESSTDLNVIQASAVEPESLEPLWPGRYFRGKVALDAGDPGTGKTLAMLDMASRITRGARWPDGSGTAPIGDVVLLTAEDSLRDTIVPRLIAAGADLSRIHIVQGARQFDHERGTLRERLFALTEDIAALGRVVDGFGGTVHMVAIDPITAYLPKIDSHATADVRGALAPLAALAERARFLALLLSHLNKTGGQGAMYRVTGSLAFVAAARSAFLYARDAENPERRIIAPIKNNLAPDLPSLSYTIGQRVIDQVVTPQPVIEWGETVEVTANELVNPRDRSVEERTEVVATWLRTLLKDGPVPTRRVQEKARELQFSDRALRRAQQVVGVRVAKAGFGGSGVWHMSLAEDTP